MVLPTGYRNFSIRRSALDNENMQYAVHRGVDGDERLRELLREAGW